MAGSHRALGARRQVLLTETDTQTDAIDKRLREAIDPMTRSIASLQNRLRELIEHAGELDPDPGTGTEPAAFGDDDPSAPGSERDGVVRRWMP